jgi:hypothetical protein
MATVDIPLEPSNPRYKFKISLEGNSYELAIHWNEYDSGWYMDLLGISNDEDIKGIKLVTGPNLLKPFAIVDLGAMYIIDGEEEGLDPTFDEIGSRYTLIHTTEPDLII